MNLYEDLQSKEQLISTMVPLLPPPTFIHSHYLAQAVPEMRRIIAEMPVLASFADFRFLTCGIGLKVSFTNPEDMPLEFPDLAWDTLDHANFLLDVGFEVSPLGSSAPSVAVWRAVSEDSRFPFSGMVLNFWGGPSSGLLPSNNSRGPPLGFLVLGWD